MARGDEEMNSKLHKGQTSNIVFKEQGTNKFIITELTVTWKARCEEAFQRQDDQLRRIMEQFEQGWRYWLSHVEV